MNFGEKKIPDLRAIISKNQADLRNLDTDRGQIEPNLYILFKTLVKHHTQMDFS